MIFIIYLNPFLIVPVYVIKAGHKYGNETAVDEVDVQYIVVTGGISPWGNSLELF